MSANDQKDDPDTGGMNHFLGEYEMPDAERILPALERERIAFEIETQDDEIFIVRPKGTVGPGPTVRIWIKSEDQIAAERIQTNVLKIQI